MHFLVQVLFAGAAEQGLAQPLLQGRVLEQEIGSAYSQQQVLADKVLDDRQSRRSCQEACPGDPDPCLLAHHNCEQVVDDLSLTLLVVVEKAHSRSVEVTAVVLHHCHVGGHRTHYHTYSPRHSIAPVEDLQPDCNLAGTAAGGHKLVCSRSLSSERCMNQDRAWRFDSWQAAVESVRGYVDVHQDLPNDSYKRHLQILVVALVY